MSIPSPGGLVSRDSCLQPDTRNLLGTSGYVFEGLPARGEPSSALLENSKNLAPFSCRFWPLDTGKIAEHRGVRDEPQGSTIPTPRFATLNPFFRTGGTYSKNCMLENPRNQISELHFGTFPDSADFSVLEGQFQD